VPLTRSLAGATISFDFNEIAGRGDDLVRFQRDRWQGRRFRLISTRSLAGATISFDFKEIAGRGGDLVQS
jgi:hypothetical protein